MDKRNFSVRNLDLKDQDFHIGCLTGVIVVCRFILLSPRRDPRRSHSTDRSSLGRPPGCPVPSSPDEHPTGHPLQSKLQDSAGAGVRVPRGRLATRVRLRSPLLTAARLSLSVQPHRPSTSGTAEQGRGGVPGRRGSLHTGQRRATSQSTGPVPRITAPAPPELLTAPQRWPHQRPTAQLQPRRGSSIFGHHVGFRPVGSQRAPAA
ncbi:hypothetical protein NDU88_005851 [Pleurodeles waltl]|uniref:Uncharacterized protein n=1 Tax=Pleurodeles waltl TaxID=8319 RepID=A0AAV7QK44_PLEWA|nr:hypothetical protein NDU88_005851 [Pleurodeles waltl]